MPEDATDGDGPRVVDEPQPGQALEHDVERGEDLATGEMGSRAELLTEPEGHDVLRRARRVEASGSVQ